MMKTIKFFIYHTYLQTKQFFCKHNIKHAVSCPYTRMTYVDCAKCLKRLFVEPVYE